MVRINQLIDRSGTGRGNGSQVGSAPVATVAVRDLTRSMDFYTRVFGFRPERRSERRSSTSVRMTGPRNLSLVIHCHGDGNVRPVSPRLGFCVGDLDDARESLWDSGVTVSRDSGEPDQIFRHSHGRSLYIRDPDGNEIELLEDQCAQPRAADRSCRVSRWRFAPRRRCRATG